MALVNTEILRAILPNIGLPVNPDGTYRIGVEDVNSDEILVAVAAAAIDLAAIEVINTAIQVATEASAVDLAAIEIINTAIQTAVQGMQAVDGAVGVAADVDGVRQAQLRYIADRMEAVENTTGATGDAMVAVGAVGTISAKLRRVTQGLEDLKTLITLAANDGVDIGDVTVNNAAAAAAVNIQDGGNVISTDIADGNDATQGAIADAAVAAGAVGTISAKLRRLTTDLDTLVTTVGAQGEGDYATPTHTWPVIGAGTTVALAANANRLYAMFVNDGTEPIYLYLGAAAVMNRGIRVNASGGVYEMSREIGNLYVGAINGICASGGMTLLVTEGV